MRWVCLALAIIALLLLTASRNAVMQAAFRGSTVVLLLASAILFYLHYRRARRLHAEEGTAEPSDEQ
jgi:uncharacterized membrane protein